MPAIEPTLDRLHNPFLRYFLATRPACPSVTFIACLIGLAPASSAGPPIQAPAAPAAGAVAQGARAGAEGPDHC